MQVMLATQCTQHYLLMTSQTSDRIQVTSLGALKLGHPSSKAVSCGGSEITVAHSCPPLRRLPGESRRAGNSQTWRANPPPRPTLLHLVNSPRQARRGVTREEIRQRLWAS